MVAAAAAQLDSSLQSAKLATGDWKDEMLASALVETAVADCLRRLTETGLWGPENRLPSNHLWKIAGQWLETGWLQTRTREKPLGYAGDYELLTRIIQEECTTDPLGRIFDRYFQQQAAAMAVRDRTTLAATLLATDCLAKAPADYPVVSFGCGPALEIRRGIEILPWEVRPRVKVTLLDLDAASLAVAAQSIADVTTPEQVREHRENLPRLAGHARAAELIGCPQLLICLGLFDYLEATAAERLLRLFWDQLGPGGILLVGNFIPSHATRAYMEWIGNWYLTYRTFGQLRQLAERVGIPTNRRRIGLEVTGSNLLLWACKG
jgi:hypothetical protein